MLELLEHVRDWKACMYECKRILRKKGLLFLTTSNWLCPMQDEYNLPFFSWYPPFLKKYYEQLATTSRPDLVNHAEFPAINWFSFYTLQKFLSANDFQCYDRFDIIDMCRKETVPRFLRIALRKIGLFRLFGHVMTRSTIVAAIRN
jgi:2-polyprenyl-6-hydroxyphenyl methylase/3-demethylubiquinone-9 3-methyltransferase